MKDKHTGSRAASMADFYRAVLSLRTKEECRAFFADICTDAEMAEISRRLLAAEMLSAGESYLAVAQATGLSTATISRVSRALQNGDGYARALARMKEKGDKA